jgi:hypothetical protein
LITELPDEGVVTCQIIDNNCGIEIPNSSKSSWKTSGDLAKDVNNK